MKSLARCTTHRSKRGYRELNSKLLACPDFDSLPNHLLRLNASYFCTSKVSLANAWITLNLIRRAFNNDVALRHNADFVCQREHHVHVVLDNNFGHTARLDLQQQIDCVVGISARHTSGWLIQKQ